MNGIAAALTCPRCGGPLEWQADGVTDGFRAAAMVFCRPCLRPWRINVTVTDPKVESKTVTDLLRTVDA